MREGYNLFTKPGWQNVSHKQWHLIKHYVLRDTFGRYICRIFGHGETFLSEPGHAERFVICCRCIQRIKRIEVEE